MSNWFYILAGVVLIITGFTAKSLINEVEMPATEEERLNARPTWKGRFLVAAIGIVGCAYGVSELACHR
jgi:hypothetical protein